MSGVGPVAGTKLYIAPPGTITATDVSWVPVKGASTIGDVSAAFTAVAISTVDSGDDYDLKGTRKFPNFACVFNRDDTDPGQQLMRTASSAARGQLYNFKLDEGDTPPVLTAVFTITIAAPGVVTQTAHGRSANDAVQLTTTGSLPTGLLTATTYYVKTVIDANSYTLSATVGGTAITTTGTQSGVHSTVTVPSNTITVWQGEVFGFGTNYGGANTVKTVKTEISIRPTTIVYTAAAQ